MSKYDSFYDYRIDILFFNRNFSALKRVINMDKQLNFKNVNENLDTHEDEQTFVIKMKHRQKGSWQGEIIWTQKKESLKFRSELELLRMIDSAYEWEISKDIDKATS